MSNPWFGVPLEDYEGHMNSPGVQQLGALSELFAEVLRLYSPASVAILGIAGGNGLEHIDNRITQRVVGVDVNPTYLEAVRQRYSLISGLELYRVDLASEIVDVAPAQLVHAALVFEHAGVRLCLKNAVSLVAKEGALSVILQLPAKSEPEVSTTSFPSMQALKSYFTLIEPSKLCEALESYQFRISHETVRPLQAGKRFWIGVFCRE
jgi:hypothetical protein